MRTICILVILILSTGISTVTAEILITDKPIVDFGFMPQHAKAVYEINFKSESKDTVHIKDINTFGQDLEINIAKKILAPSESTTAEIIYNSGNLVGAQWFYPRILDKNNIRIAKIAVKAFILKDIKAHKRIYVTPPIINTSQFGDKGADEFSFEIINTCDETVPFKIVYCDTTFFSIDFPLFVKPNKKAKGKIKLNEKGKSNNFVKSITFEFIDKHSEKRLYSIPVKRRIFKSDR